MSELETDYLIQGLRGLAARGIRAPGVPFGLWREIGQLVPQPAVEMIISNTGEDVLLTYRDDDYWSGWHIPGGFSGCGESLADTCQRLGRHELGADVRLLSVIDSFAWPDHPYGNALSLLCHCELADPPGVGRFFAEPPTHMVRYHRDFMLKFQAWARRGR
ncbi:MAG TPA: NUDIX hydrolase [Polyangiaceae bacterium]|nr:NUDIX hydrolase [Polyangiaceae bacterium]